MTHLRSVSLLLCFILASCGGRSTGNDAIPLPFSSPSAFSGGATVDGFPVTISMFALPDAADSAFGITIGSDGAAWVASARHMNRVNAGGVMTTFNTPLVSGYTGASLPNRDPLTTGPDGAVWFAGLIQSNPTAVAQYCLGDQSCTQPVRVTPTGQFTVMPVPPPLPSNFVYNIAKGPAGTVWVTYTQSFSSQYRLAALNPNGSARFERVLPNEPEAMTMGSDGAMYVSAALGESSFELWKLDSDGNITQRFRTGILAQDMAFGRDGNLWLIPYTAGSINVIERVKPSGRYTDFRLPHPTVSLAKITAGADGAMWYTDFHNREIGRITMSGSVSVLPLNDGCAGGPLGIAACPGKCENAHGRLWFTQGNEVGRLQF